MQHKNFALSSALGAGPEQNLIHRLPVSLTLLVGREREVAEICTLLQRPNIRLLTLVGTGGVGKTRLALAVAQALLDDFADGACFVPLATVSDATRVMEAIAQALGLWEVGDLPVEEHVRTALRDRHLLLLLDNFEHLIEAAPQLTVLLASCPLVSILVTSRAAPHLSGEQEYPVPPLALPDLTRLPEPQTLAQLAAIHLFVLRAQAIQPSFQLTSANARAVADICVGLDGLPLAIELAAARIKLLPPHALVKRLAHRLDVLTGGARDLPSRQQTLRNTLQWSYDLLSQEEQRLFRWLSIFVGGCTLDTAEHVCRLSQADSAAPQASGELDTITSLIDKSLVQQAMREGEEPRLVMLETVREFGLECLQRQGELEAARHAHAHYFLAFAEEAEPHLLGPEQLLWFNRLERELDNLRTILRAAISEGETEVEMALRLGSALQFFWLSRGYLREGRSILEQLLAQTVTIAASIRLKALIAIGMFMMFQSEAHGLEQTADEALALAQELGDQWNRTGALIVRAGAMMLVRHDYTAAQVCLEEVLTSAKAHGDHFALGTAFLNLGSVALYQQDYPRAIALFEESLAQFRALGNMVAASTVLFTLAVAELSQGNATRARILLEECSSSFRAFGNTLGVALVLGVLGQMAFLQGEMSQAEAFLADSARLAAEIGDQRNIAHMHLLLAGLAALQGDFAVAGLRYEEGLATALELDHMDLIAFGLKGLGCLAVMQGLSTWAAELWGAAESLHESPMIAFPPAIYDPMVVMVRSQMGEQAYEQAMAEGRTMMPAQVLASSHATSTPPSQKAHLSTGSSPTVPMRHSSYPAGLTAREVEVLQLVSQGMTDAQVAEQLIISYRTVTTHLASIYNKLGVNSRAAAARFAVEHQLV